MPRIAPTTAEAQRPTGGYLIPFDGAQRVVIWKSAADLMDGIKIMGAKGGPEHIAQLVRCVPPNGARVAVLNSMSRGGRSLHEVIVLDGSDSECRVGSPISTFALGTKLQFSPEDKRWRAVTLRLFRMPKNGIR
jgi:hypothetical protein